MTQACIGYGAAGDRVGATLTDDGREVRNGYVGVW